MYHNARRQRLLRQLRRIACTGGGAAVVGTEQKKQQRTNGGTSHLILCPLCFVLPVRWAADVLVCHPPARGEVGWLPRPAKPIVNCRLGWAIYNLQSAFQREPKVSNYTIEELIARWKREELTIEQVIGQILLLLKEQDRRLREAVPPPPQRHER